MNRENSLAPLDVGTIDNDTAIKSPRTKQCGIENIRTVGGRDEDHSLIRFETVHFDQQLVQRLFALVVAATETGPAVTTNRVDFVDEDNAGGVLLALLEEIANAGGADANEHLDEVGATDREKWDVCFARYGPCEERLTRPGRPHQEHPLGDAAAKLLE